MSLQDFIGRLRRVGPEDPGNFWDAIPTDEQQEIRQIIESIQVLKQVTIDSLAGLYAQNPAAMPVLVSCLGWSLERLKNEFKGAFESAGLIELAQKRPREVIEWLDQNFNLVRKVDEQRSRRWSFEDVAIERNYWSHRKGSQSVGQGRMLEDVIEEALKPLGLPYEMRTHFVGRGLETAPADLAIPAGGDEAVIVCAVKGFDSTGSKLTDAVREIEAMAQVRRPDQFVLAMVDGVGWRRRVSDLGRIYSLYERNSIDGLYTISDMESLRNRIHGAARMRKLLE